jgi:putative membrane protein
VAPPHAAGYRSVMNAVAQLLAILLGLMLILIGVSEAFFHTDRRFQRTFGLHAEDVPAVRTWAINVGFYNMVFGVSLLVGVALSYGGDPAAARTLVGVLAAGQAVLGLVLFATDRRLWRGALVQTLLPIAVIVATLL